MLADLNAAERLRLMQFVCSFAWADLEVRDEERAFIRGLIRRLALDAEEQAQVQRCLGHQVSPDRCGASTVRPSSTPSMASSAPTARSPTRSSRASRCSGRSSTTDAGRIDDRAPARASSGRRVRRYAFGCRGGIGIRIDVVSMTSA